MECVRGENVPETKGSGIISDETQAIGPVPDPRPATDGWLLGGRYRVLARIGSGGMAEVFRARDEVLDREVAVKVFRAEQVAHDDAHGVERQQLEVAALARLNHPNLIQLFDGSIGDGPHAYIVMELIDGPPLSARIADGPLPEPSVREIGIQVAGGLAYVHSQGMVHRDVKPDNILLGVDRSDDDSTVRARLSDFGIVRLLGSERLTSVNFTLGTASYLAPEQARGSDVAPPTDIYSLGLVLLEALTGQRAFTGTPLEAAAARLTQRPAIPADLPEPWPGLLYAMTEFDPGLRPSASEVARALRNEGSRSLPLVPLAVPVAAGFADAPTGMVAAAPQPAAASASGPVPPPRHRHRPSALVITAAASVLVIAATIAIFLLTGNDSQSPAAPPPTQDKSTSAAAKQTRSDHSESPSNHRNVPAPVGSSAPQASRSRSTSAPSQTGSASATHSSRPTSSAPTTSSAPHTSTPATTSPAAPSTPASSAGTTPPRTSGSSPAGATSTGTASQSPNSQTTTSPAG